MVKTAFFLLLGLVSWMAQPAFARQAKSGDVRRLAANILPEKRSHPLDAKIESFLKQQRKTRDVRKLSVQSANDYLRLINGQVAVFRQYQATNGAIIDPQQNIEWQYSTPCYALSVALLHCAGFNNDPLLLESGVKAMDLSVTQMNEYRCAHNHGEFYLQPVMMALDLYSTVAPSKKEAEWRAKIAPIDPYKLHPDNLKRKKTVYNHNVVALAGEILRMKQGLAADTDFFHTHLENQRQYLTELGMYKDPNVPMVYDEFSRQFLTSVLCEETGPGLLRAQDAAFYKERLWRGAWTSLFMQSPYGECPTGGRSAQHIWNEAQMCVTYEIYAAQYARLTNDPVATRAAGAFKRAAHLSLQSIQDWIRPDGAGYVVKNRFPPEARHGFERYSAQSQYNLLACWLMAVAYLYSDESIPEQPAPADIGGFVLPLVDDFHKVFANAGGTYIEYDTSGQERYNPTGLLRIHLPSTLPQLGPSDGIVHKFDPQTKADLGGENLCVGPAWPDAAGKWHRLADYSPTNPPSVRILKESPREVSFEVLYTGDFNGATRIRQIITVSRDGVKIEDRIDGPDRMRIYYPMLVFDGIEHARVNLDGPAAVIQLRGSAVEFSIQSPSDATLNRAGSMLDFRNGQAEPLFADIQGTRTVYRIRSVPVRRR
jgi:hypothetical protein